MHNIIEQIKSSDLNAIGEICAAYKFSTNGFANSRAHLRAHLRAWNSADEYLLAVTLLWQKQQTGTIKVLIVNDDYGALSTFITASLGAIIEPSLNAVTSTVVNYTDSYAAQLCAQYNLEQTRKLQARQSKAPIAQPELSFIGATSPLANYFNYKFDLVLLKLPKNIALLKSQLEQLATVTTENSCILIANMQKHWSSGYAAAFSSLQIRLKRAKSYKKANLQQFDMSHALWLKQPFFAQNFLNFQKIIQVDCANLKHKIELAQLENVHGGNKLDLGARLMLENFEQLPKAETVVDLGCGNGVLGIIAKQYLPAATIHFIDESYMALDSAAYNFARIFPHQEAHFYLSDIFSHCTINNAQLILCNPPFHSQHSINLAQGRNMFKAAKKVLSADGELWVVGNRHLNYYHDLAKIFKRVQLVATNSKFQLLKAQ